jgi:hypothetical protein
MKNDNCRWYLCENYSFHGLKGPHSREGNTEMYTAGLLEVEEGCRVGKESKAEGKEDKDERIQNKDKIDKKQRTMQREERK